MKNGNTRSLQLSILGLLFLCISCTKLVTIQPPSNSITTSQVFDDSADAEAALAGIYANINNTGVNVSFGNGSISLLCGTSADEMLIFGSYYGSSGDDLMYNQIQDQLDGNFIDASFWTPGYQLLYQANSVIEGVQSSKTISETAKAELSGEALFLRAFINFYLVNLFGPIPIITGTDYTVNAKASRSAVTLVYQTITSDLVSAQSLLPADYSAGGGERIRANKWAATALLARTYLYEQKWDSAELQATSVINNASLFSLDSNLNNVFLANNPEAILQWNLNTAFQPYNATSEGWIVIPYNNTVNPNFYVSTQLLSAFEPGDLRMVEWLDSTNYQGTVYYYPFKYKVGPQPNLTAANTSASEYYIVLRLGEQYLIRAEARARQNNNLVGAISDVNAIRSRANLQPLVSSLAQTQILAAVMQERRIELFAEWGNRWLDLKRTGAVDSVMAKVTPLKGAAGAPAWQSYQQLYPIPFSELQESPNMTQNPGY